MKSALIHVLMTVLALGSTLGVVGFAVLWSGLYDVSVNSNHTLPVYRLLEVALDRSVRHHARTVQVPDLSGRETILLGAACFANHCEQCHGAPGVAQQEIGQAMQPVPGPLVDATQRWSAAQIYWITRNGIKMSGMPAWQWHLRDEQLWSITAFLQVLPSLTASDYRSTVDEAARSSCPGRSHENCPAGTSCATGLDERLAGEVANDDLARGALQQYGCVGCHVIPGLVGPDTHVGPPLTDLHRRTRIVGDLPNDTNNLSRWIRDPGSIKPGTVMPNLGVPDADARLMAEYLSRAH